MPTRTSGHAGCACGEVFEVSFDDSVNAPIAPAARPVGWTEDATVAGWSARLLPSTTWGVRTAVALVLPCAVYVVRALVIARANTAVAVVLLMLLPAALAYRIFVSRRAWSFSFDAQTFRVDAVGSHVAIPLDDVQRFHIEQHAEKAHVPLLAHVLCVQRRNQATKRIPLAVATEAEAVFVAERANAILAAGGRDIEVGYRGERLRVGVAPPMLLDDAPEPDYGAARQTRAR